MKSKQMNVHEAAKAGISRQAWISRVSNKPRSHVSHNRFKSAIKYECCHRGEVIGETPCKTCGSKTGTAELHSCTIHGKCTVRKNTKYSLCQTCPDRKKENDEVPFGDFMDSHTGACYIFGSGKTEFNYNEIAAIKSPMFYINQAAQLADRAPKAENYMIALDKKQNIYFEKFPGTLLLPRSQNMTDARGANPAAFKRNNICRWDSYGFKKGELELDRKVLQKSERLYQGQTGFAASIMPLLHFVWFAGFDTVNLVGCDGANAGYDERLTNRTGQKHSFNSDPGGNRFSNFRLRQDEIGGTLGLTLNYL